MTHRYSVSRHFTYRSDKMSRLAPMSELIEWRSPCVIRSLTEGSRMAHILREQLE